MIRVLVWIGTTLGVLVIVAVGLFAWGPSVQHGTEVCVRCAAQREVTCCGPFRTHPDPAPSAVRTWVEAHVGACLEHDWRSTGCWSSARMISCTKIPDGHTLFEALASLDDAASIELAHRFRSLAQGAQRRVWESANRRWSPDSVSGVEREIARSVAEEENWNDLVLTWTR